MSLINGGAAPKPCNRGRNCCLVAGSAGWSLSSRRRTCRPRATTSKSSLQGWSSRSRRPKTVLAHRIMRPADLKRHLVIGAEIDRLHIAPCTQIPEVEMVAVLVREQVSARDRKCRLSRDCCAIPYAKTVMLSAECSLKLSTAHGPYEGLVSINEQIPSVYGGTMD
jgi:hypothetical protein